MPRAQKQVTAVLQKLEISNKRIRSMTDLLQQVRDYRPTGCTCMIIEPRPKRQKPNR